MLRSAAHRTALIVTCAALAFTGEVRAGDDALTIYSDGLEAILVDPKDTSLVDLLRLLDDRVLELPAELDEQEMPAPLIKMVIDGLMSPMTLRAGMIPGADPMQGPPIYAQLDIHDNAHVSAQHMAGQVDGLLSMVAPAPSEPLDDWPTINMIEADGAKVFHGISRYRNGEAFTLAMGELAHEPGVPPAIVMPRGVKPAIAFEVDLKKVQPLIEMMLEQAPPGEAEMARTQLEMYGMLGPDAAHVQYAAGHGSDRMHHVIRLNNSMRMLTNSGMAPTSRVTARTLQQVPADATYAQVSVVNLMGYDAMVRRMMEGMPGSPFEGEEDVSPYDMMRDMFKQNTGLDPIDDLLSHLGQAIGGYMSDTTGGGGILSTVWFVEVRDTAALQRSLDSLCNQANELAVQHANGYVRFQHGELSGRKVTMLTFPGLPIPLEFCMAIANGYLYAAPTPTGLEAAIAQGAGNAKNLTHHPRFTEMGGSNLDNAMQVTFLDTPRAAQQGYGLVAMGMAALSNAVRSPARPRGTSTTAVQNIANDRGVAFGQAIPSYHALMKDAKASVQIMRIDGDDIVGHVQTDRSFLVNACGAVGMVGGSAVPILGVALAGGLVFPALGKARQQAMNVKSMTMLRQIAMAVQIYTAEHGKGPTSLNQLVEMNYLSAEITTSPLGPMWDEHGDFWLDSSGRDFDSIEYPNLQILGYDRAMFAGGDQVAVVFYDGHVEQMYHGDFIGLTQREMHEGVDFKLPW